MMNRSLPLFLLCCLVVALSGPALCAAQDRGKGQYRTTQLELQSQLMSFADQLTGILGQARYEVSMKQPDLKVRTLVRNDFTLSLASAFKIAASANPEIGLLDMVVMVTLGRMIYEERWRAEVGESIQPMLTAFKQLETDIWSIAATVLTPSEQKELRYLISRWRRENPQQFIFSYIRFSDFAAERHGVPRDKGEKPSGLFKAVRQATQSVDKMLLLAERGLYLGARIPMLMSTAANLGLMNMLGTKEIQQIQGDMKMLAESMSRLADASEKLPSDLLQDLMSEERRLRGLLADLNKTLIAGTKLMTSANTTLNVTTDLVAQLDLNGEAAGNQWVDLKAMTGMVEQLNTMITSLGVVLKSPTLENYLPQLLEEKRLEGLLINIQKTLMAGNEFMVSANTTLSTTSEVVTRLGLDQATTKGQSIDPVALTSLAEHVNTLAMSLRQLLESTGWQQRMPQIMQVIDRSEQIGKNLVDRAFIRTLVLILILLFGSVLAGLLYRYVSRKL